MKKILSVLLFTLGLSLMGELSWATKVYITDSCRVSLRRGPGTEYKIQKFLPAGLSVEVLESQNDWIRVHLLTTEEGSKEKAGTPTFSWTDSRLQWMNGAMIR